MIIALAGRRIDAADAKQPRFPLHSVPIVRERLRHMFNNLGAIALVCSAACGADLIALSQAGALGLRRRVVLPFDRQSFRETSVNDRPGEWGPLYDRIIDEVVAAGDLVTMHYTSEEEAYAATNRAILDEAISLAKHYSQPATAALVWDGISRGDHDITEAFGVEARKRGLPLVEVNTQVTPR